MRILELKSSVVGVACAMGATASGQIINGDFESGHLQPAWTSGSINGGFGSVVEEGTCFSALTTTGITLPGDFSGRVRPSGPAPADSVGILTSDPFTAESFIFFRALSETSGFRPNPVTFTVSLIDLAGNVLFSQIVPTSVVNLFCCGCADGTLADPRDGSFSSHVINVSAHAGQTVRLEFRLHTNFPGSGFFTLVDDVKSLGIDSDGDGLTDVDEVTIYGTDPTDSDTDNDGLLDGTEVDISVDGCPDPLSFDSDGDLVADGSEVNDGSDPCAADSDGDGLPDGIDPDPLDPGGVGGELEAMARNLCDVIRDLDASLFNGPNDNANQGRRNALANRACNAAKKLSNDNIDAAIGMLTLLLEKVDGDPIQPDWMDASSIKDALREAVELLIAILIAQ